MKKFKNFGLILAVLVLSAIDMTSAFALGFTGFLSGGERTRELFNELRNLEMVSVQESFLRQENTLSNSSGVYTYDFTKAVNSSGMSVEPQLQLLDKNDAFVATGLGVYIYEAIVANPGYVPNGLQTAVNPVLLTTDAGFTKDHINQLYNGKLLYKVSNTIAIEAIDMQQFETRPVVQAGWDTTLSILETDIVGSKRGEDGIKDVASFLYFDGIEDNTIQIVAPLFNGIKWQQTAAGKQIRVVVKTHGLLIKGGHKYADKIKAAIKAINA